MNGNSKTRWNRSGVVLSLLLLLCAAESFILPFINDSDFSIIRFTICDLISRQAPAGLIMKWSVISLAAANLCAGWIFYRGQFSQRLFLMIFISSITLAAFSADSRSSGRPFPGSFEKGWDDLFLYCAGLSFIILSLTTGFTLKKQSEWAAAMAAGISVILLSFLKSEYGQLAGIIQRAEFVIAFGWLVYSFRNVRFEVIRKSTSQLINH
jgi:hypothetical protein